MQKRSDILIIGLAMFAMFFGAGNMLFPPYLGLLAGKSWPVALTAFFIGGMGLALLTLISIVINQNAGDKHLGMDTVTAPLGKTLSIVIAASILLCAGPLFSTPRTCAAAYEMLVVPMVSSSTAGSWMFSVAYFAFVFAMAVRPAKVIDIVGKILTPGLIIGLVVLFVVNIYSPIGPISEIQIMDNAVKEGIIAAYQSMDVFGALMLATIIIMGIEAKGYTEGKDKLSACVKASIVAAICLALVYTALVYLGATGSTLFPADIDRTNLLVSITRLLLGDLGVLLLGIVMALACVTTAIGHITCISEYFSRLSNGKVSYQTVAIIGCVVSCVIANVGFTAIVKLATPVLSLVYPPVLALVGVSFLNKYIKNLNVHRMGAFVAFIFSIAMVAGDYGVQVPLLSSLPFADAGLAWILPTVAGCILGGFIPMRAVPVEGAQNVNA